MSTKSIAVLFTVLLAAGVSAYADIVPPIRWDIETGRLQPRPYELSIRRGESIKIEPRFTSYTTPISLTGATIEMRYSASYDSESFYTASGTAQSDTGRVQIAWNDSLNPTNNAMVYEIRATLGTNVLARAYGPLTFLGGMVGVNTGLVARTSLDWSTIQQANGSAVLSNQMGSGATWSGSQWEFAGGSSTDLSFTNTLAPRSWVAGFSNCPATYNSDFRTVDIALPEGVTGQLFQESHVVVINNTGSMISNGAVVQLSQASGFNAAAKLASNTNGFSDCFSTLGFATHNIAHGSIGKITTFGNVNELNTTGFAEGTNIWLGVTPGTYQAYMPTNAGQCRVALGMVTREHANVGRVYVRVQYLPDTDDIGAAPLAHSQPLSTITNAGTAAASNASDFATAQQGALADTAIQAGTNYVLLNEFWPTTNFISIPANEYTEFGVSRPIGFNWGISNDVRYLYVDQDGYFHRQNGESGTTQFTLYDSGNFLAGTHYLAPNGSGASLTGITAAQVGALPIGGGTLTGAVYTTIDQGVASPADTELATAGWVRDLFPATVQYYSTSNDNTVVTGLGYTVRTLSESIPPLSSGVFTTGLTNNGYLASIATTNKITAQGTATINAYISAVGGVPSPSLTIHPEIYASADGTNTYGDWETANQAITLGGTTNLYTFVVPIGSITNSYVVRRWKIGTANNITSIRFHNGTNGVDTASRMGLTVSGDAVQYELTAEKIAQAGGVTNAFNDPVIAPTGSYNLLADVVSGTVTVTRAKGNSLYLAPTGAATYITADLSTFPTNSDTLAMLTVYFTTQTWGFVSAAITNVGSVAQSNKFNNFILLKGCGWTNFTARGEAQ